MQIDSINLNPSRNYASCLTGVKTLSVYRKISKDPSLLKLEYMGRGFYKVTYKNKYDFLIKKDSKVVFGLLIKNDFFPFQMPQDENNLYSEIVFVEKVFDDILKPKSGLFKLFK